MTGKVGQEGVQVSGERPILGRRLVFGLIILSTSFLLTVSIVELALRLENPVGRAELGLLFGIQPRSNYEEDEKLSYRPRDRLYFWDDKAHPPTAQKAENAVRVFALGDSFTKAHGSIGRKNSFYRQVQRHLEKEVVTKGFEFFHFGVSGYCEVQFLELLRRFGPKYSPDWAIVQVYLGNDVGENCGLIDRRLSLVRSGKMAGKVFIADAAERRNGQRNGKLTSAGRERFPGMSTICDYSYACGFLRERVLSLVHRVRSSQLRPIRSRVALNEERRPRALAGINTGSHFIDLMRIDSSSEIERGWQMTDELICDIAAEGQEQNIRLVFVLLPQELQVNKAAWAGAVRLFGLNPGNYDIDLPSNRFRGLLEERGIPVLDLTTEFRAAIDNGADLYDRHLNKAGHDKVAELVISGLSLLGWVH